MPRTHRGTSRDTRRSPFSGLGAMSLFLAAVIVLTSSPALVAGQLSDPSSPISRVGSQLRRIAAAVPARLIGKAARRAQDRPDTTATTRRDRALVGAERPSDGQTAAVSLDHRWLTTPMLPMPPPARV